MCSQSQLLVSECQIGQHSSLAPARPGCGSKSQVIFCRAGTQPGPVRLCTGPPCYICHCQTQLIINLPPAEPGPARLPVLVTGPALQLPQLLACCLAWLPPALQLPRPVSDGRRPESEAGLFEDFHLRPPAFGASFDKGL